MSEQLNIIKDNAEVSKLINYLKDKDIVAVDCETDGLEKRAHVIGYSIAAENDVAYYVITRRWNREKQVMEVLETNDTAAEVMRVLAGKQLVFHNGIFDVDKLLTNYGVDLTDAMHFDTMIAAHLLDENRKVGLKQLGAKFYGDSALKEQEEMVASIEANGGKATKTQYELFKANANLIAKYGAKDAILTFRLYWEFLEELMNENLDKFFFEEESMPLLRGPSMDMNCEGLKVNTDALSALKRSLQTDIAVLDSEIYDEIKFLVETKYPMKKGQRTFNLNSGAQIAWLLYEQLGETFNKVTDTGKVWAKYFGVRGPYNDVDKRHFIHAVNTSLAAEQIEHQVETENGLETKKLRAFWNYVCVDEEALKKHAKKYRWVEKLLQMKKMSKLLSTYVEGIEESLQYGIIRPSFLQHGTTSGRYSSRNPNFTNLPRDDKRIKSCIVSRPGKVFVGADFEQIEPRIFASLSGDERLLNCFRNGEDFYSVIGMEIFNISNAVPLKEGHPNAFGVKYKRERQISKTIALAVTYGASAARISAILGISTWEAQDIIDRYFEAFPKVKKLQTQCHRQVKTEGRVVSMFGRPRRLPEGVRIASVYAGLDWMDLPYQAKTILNLSVNFINQSAAASILNRSMIAFKKAARTSRIDCRIVLAVHDEVIVECMEKDAQHVLELLKHSMENTCAVPDVQLVAIPKIGKSLADLK